MLITCRGNRALVPTKVFVYQNPYALINRMMNNNTESDKLLRIKKQRQRNFYDANLKNIPKIPKYL